MKKYIFLVLFFLILAGGISWILTTEGRNFDTEIVMYKNLSCMCCEKWADHLEENGFKVEMKTVNNLLELKSENDVPGELASCHTAFVEGYIVEGHVPAEDVRRLIYEKPDAAGITVPGMPIGSPGMEGSYVQNYDVILFDKDGKEEVFARY